MKNYKQIDVQNLWSIYLMVQEESELPVLEVMGSNLAFEG